LVCYPDSDDGFGADAATYLSIQMPPGYSTAEIVAVVEERLREKYPAATIRIGELTQGGGEISWHVYRDGHPALS